MRCDETPMSKVVDEDTGYNLYQILNKYNHINVGYCPSSEFARRCVRQEDRKHGLYLTYYLETGDVTEIATINDNDIDNDDLWVADESWQPASLDAIVARIPTVDNDDLSIVNSKLQFADRKSSVTNNTTIGLKFVRRNIVNLNGVQTNILSESMLSEEDTIYVIKYDFNLNGAAIKLPHNSTLLLYGGMITNGTIKGNSSDIVGAGTVDCNLTGSWKKQGVSTNRPTNPIIGYSYYDTTINRPIWWNGVNWVNANGEVV